MFTSNEIKGLEIRSPPFRGNFGFARIA